MMQRLWSRLSLTPRLGIIIVLALLATQVLDEILVHLVPPPAVLFYTHDWLSTQVAEAVRVANGTAAADRDSAVARLNSQWLRYSTASSAPQLDRHDSEPLNNVRAALQTKLGGHVRQVFAVGTPLHDPDRATSTMTVIIAALPAVLRAIRTEDDFEGAVIAAGQVQIAVQLLDGDWLLMTEPGRESTTARRIRNVVLLFGGLALIAGFALFAARMVIRPLRHLSAAADRLGRDRELSELPKTCVPEIDAIVDSFNQMQQRLKRFVDERTYMLAAISHDLRTPLTRVRLFAEYVSDEQQRKLVLNDIEEMEQMLRASLTFAGDESRLEPHSAVDLATLLISLCDTVSDAGSKAIYEGPDHAVLPCQPVAMRRAFANIIDNACKYGHEAQVRLLESVDVIEVTVADRGPGIPSEHIALAFLPFRRLEGSRNRESGGVGLGLTIARDVFHGHGGSITLEPAASGGLLARIRLPKPVV
jgi:signal transduction histidine kinase